MSAESIIKLVIDKKNKIIAIGGEWDSAAKQGNAVESLAEDKVLGKSIESFLGGDVTQMYYDAVFKLCRLKNETIVREYRCDSPTHRRYMKMVLTPLEDGSIQMTHETLKEIPFENEVTIVDKTLEKNFMSVHTKRCSICNRLLYPNSNKWVSPEELSEEKPLYVKVIHSVCEDCKNINWFPSK